MFAGLLLSGTNDVSLDLKGRMAIPARYKDVIKDESDGQLIVTRSLFDKCLWIYPTSEWENVVESLGALPTITDPLCRTIQRIVLGSAVFCSLDAQGRILIPQELRTEASPLSASPSRFPWIWTLFSVPRLIVASLLWYRTCPC